MGTAVTLKYPRRQAGQRVDRFLTGLPRNQKTA